MGERGPIFRGRSGRIAAKKQEQTANENAAKEYGRGMGPTRGGNAGSEWKVHWRWS